MALGELLAVDQAHPTPAYLQLQEGLRGAILRGEFAPGEALPSERDLADALGLSRMTVRRALELLVGQKLAERRQGSGTYVLPRRLEQQGGGLVLEGAGAPPARDQAGQAGRILWPPTRM